MMLTITWEWRRASHRRTVSPLAYPLPAASLPAFGGSSLGDSSILAREQAAGPQLLRSSSVARGGFVRNEPRLRH